MTTPLPPADQDSPWKEALEHFLAPFLEFFFPKAHRDIDWGRGYQALDKEFQQIVREAAAGKVLADKLFKVWKKTGRQVWILIHVEIQAQVDRGFPKRMFDYNQRAHQLYQRPVISLALLCDEDPNWRPTSYGYGDWGSYMGLTFRAEKLLDYTEDLEALERSANPIAQVVLAHHLARATRQDPAGRYREKIRLVKGLYERGWSAADVRQLFRVIDWLLALASGPQEQFRQEIHHYEEEKRMPYVTSVERLAKEEGRQEGREEGRRQGLLVGIELDLEHKFGAAGLKLLTKIRGIQDPTQLEALARGLKTAATLTEFRRLLR